ncbi:MAG: hypothetical protein AB7O67_05970 [Vicinamibacterales bacterium]
MTALNCRVGGSRVWLLVAASVLCASTALVAQALDRSGTWTSSGGDVEIVRNVHRTPRGWDGTVEALERARDYTLTIEQSDDGVIVAFPGGSRHMLTMPVYPFGESRTTVEDGGDFWTKHVTSARWTGEALELQATTFSGWWKDAPPEAVSGSPEQLDMRLVLAAGATPEDIVMRATLKDEKGEVEYVQRFKRAP